MTASARTFRQRIGEWKSQCRLCPASNTGFGNSGPGFPALSASLTVPTSLLSWPREALHPTSVPAEAVTAAMAMEIGKRAIGSPLVCGRRTSAARRLCATFNKMEGNRALARYLEAEFSGADMAPERFRLTTALRRTAVRFDANPLQTVSICGSSNRLRSSEVKRQGRVSASKSCLSTPARK
jgi:hypothetical protein